MSGDTNGAPPRSPLLDDLATRCATLVDDGLFKRERVLASPQSAHIGLTDGRTVLNLCANNYLGLADHPAIVEAAQRALDTYGYGMASVRFICGTQTVHKELEAELSQFLGTDDTILYSSCFDANGGLFETLLDEQDCVISDALNHASIIDGVRLCKARRLRYANNDMAELERRLQEASDAAPVDRHRRRLLDGRHASPTCSDLRSRRPLRRDSSMVDDSHAVGFVGAGGRGTPEHSGVMDGSTSSPARWARRWAERPAATRRGRREIIAWLRQRSRPYLFSNTLAPVIAADLATVARPAARPDELRDPLATERSTFRDVPAAGFRCAGAGHPIIPVMLGDAALANRWRIGCWRGAST